MPKCPICGKKIDYLYLIQTTVEECIFYVDGDECIAEPHDSWPLDYEPEEFICPKCNETLFELQEDAEEFLKTGKVPEYLVPKLIEKKLEE